jgi:branched-chain amino acid transport system ATP-binding protein
MDEICLEVKDLSIQFGGLKAVDKVSFQVKKGELAGLIGPNGAGKTTVFNMFPCTVRSLRI